MSLIEEQSDVVPSLAVDPILATVFKYARGRRGGRAFPALTDIELFDVPVCVPFMFTMAVTGSPPRFKYKFSGTKVDEIMGHNPMGRFVDDIYPRSSHRIVQSYAELAQRMRPQLLRASFAPPVGPPRILLRLAMPLSDDGKTLTHILGALVMHYDHAGYTETPSPARPSLIDIEYFDY